MDIVKKLKSFGIIFGIIAIVIGVLLAFRPVQAGILLNTAVGAGLLVMGAVKAVQEIMSRKETQRSGVYLIFPVLMAILGVYILINPGVTMFTIGIIISIFAFIMAIDRFASANMRRKNGMSCKWTVIEGIIHLLFGLFMCYNAIEVLLAITIVTGIYLILVGVMIIVSSIYLKDL